VTDFAETLPGGMEAVLRTIAYFDTVNQATRVRKPTLVSLGLRDPAVRPDTVRAVYRALPSEKKLVEYESGHDWNPKMIEADRDWITTK
jgi:cephalosporin-C deacetylase